MSTPYLPTSTDQPGNGGRVGLFDLARGWAVAPYPVEHRHPDGSTGSRYVCPSCNGAQL